MMRYLLIRLMLILLIGFLFIFLPIEYYVRYHFITRNFWYLEICRNEFPFFKLTKEYHSGGVTIHDSRREFSQRQGRKFRVAFVGDSVTFGAGASDEDSYVEKVQNGQDIFDAYNFGVPGYGIPEVESVIQSRIKNQNFQWVVYTYNLNDLYPAMAWNLPLLTRPETRFTTIEEQNGLKGRVKLFIKDHAKSVIIIKNILSKLFESFPHKSQGDTGKDLAGASQTPLKKCYEYIKKEAQSDVDERSYQVWSSIYLNPEWMDRLCLRLKSLKNQTESGGVKLVVIIFCDFLVLDHQRKDLISSLEHVFERAGIDYLDFYPLFLPHYRECDFYSDPTHPGPVGYAYMAQWISEYLIREFNEDSSSGS